MEAPPGKRKLDGEDSYDNMEIMPLGAGQEVGRSCVVLKYRGKTVMFDCGIHPARSGISGLPFFDEIDPSTIDVLLITQYVYLSTKNRAHDAAFTSTMQLRCHSSWKRCTFLTWLALTVCRRPSKAKSS